MSILQAIILGIVQGITEFLPISSSGHLLIIPEIFEWPEHALDFDVTVHLATLVALLWVFWPDIKEMLNLKNENAQDRELAAKLIVATIPVGVVGVLLSGGALDTIKSPAIVLSGLMGWGALLWIADIYSTKRKAHIEKAKQTSWWRAILIGCVQAIALIPGTSRSGITMTFGLFSGLDRTTAARFSLLLAIPAIAGAGLVTGIDAMNHGFETPAPALMTGFVCALISGIFAIKVLLKLVSHGSYAWFGAYRILLGAILWLLLL